MVRTMIPIAIIVIAIGCQNDSDRVSELATRHATQQAELSRETVKLQAELIEGTQQLVEADAQARRDFLELEGKLDDQRAELGRRHDDLEEERRDIATQRYRDPIVANVVIAVGSVLACLLPLLLAGYLLRCQLREPEDHTATEILLDEIVATHPALMASGRPLIAHNPGDSVPNIAGDTQSRDGSDQSTHTSN